MEALFRPVTKRICSMPFCTSSSTTYWTIGFRATGSISLGCDFVAGSSRVPTPATGTIALLITSRLYLIKGKEKANGRSGATGRATEEDRADRWQVCGRASVHSSGPPKPCAPGALFRRGSDQREGGRDRGRRALRNREALRKASTPWKHGHFNSHRITRRSARFAFRRRHPALGPPALGLSRYGDHGPSGRSGDLRVPCGSGKHR